MKLKITIAAVMLLALSACKDEAPTAHIIRTDVYAPSAQSNTYWRDKHNRHAEQTTAAMKQCQLGNKAKAEQMFREAYAGYTTEPFPEGVHCR